MKRAIFALLALGCGDNGFDSPTEVRGPRLLAIVAEPPEALPGEDVALTPFVANAEGLEFEWTIELSPRALAAAAGQAIDEDAAPIVLTGAGVTLSGEETDAAIARLLEIVGDAETGTPEAVVRQVYETVGLVVVANVIARDQDGAVVLDGFKRFALTPRADRTTNPPPPRFAIDGVWVSARGGGDPFACVPERDAPLVDPSSTVTLAPDPDEGWIETFPSLDIEGRVAIGTEDAYYSWFSTGGEFSSATTRPPDRDVEWTAPDGDAPIWLVVRDGHLGTSACRAEVGVR